MENSAVHFGIAFAEPLKALEARKHENTIPLSTARYAGEMTVDDFVVMEAVESPYESLRQELKSRIANQPSAVDAIIEAIDRKDVRLDNDQRPIANLAFLGPTGVGKSECARVLSELLGSGEINLLKIDCSNFSHGHEVALLTGSPPGYIGRDQKPLLNKESIGEPGTVILFDEIEKGSPELYNLMLQIMGDGHLRTNNDVELSFRDTVVILTSNLGAREMTDQLSDKSLGFTPIARASGKQSVEKTALTKFTEFFSPEFVNRLNKMVVFHPLGEDGLGKVLDIKLAAANKEYESRFGAHLSLSEASRSHLVMAAMKEPHLGARPLIRAFENNVQSMFGRYAGNESIPEGTHVRVYRSEEVSQRALTASGGEYVFAAKYGEPYRKQVAPTAIAAVQFQEVGADTEDEPRDESDEGGD